MYAEKFDKPHIEIYTCYISINCGKNDVGKYTFYILEKMYADPPVIEHFGTKTKQGRETLSFNV